MSITRTPPQRRCSSASLVICRLVELSRLIHSCSRLHSPLALHAPLHTLGYIVAIDPVAFPSLLALMQPHGGISPHPGRSNPQPPHGHRRHTVTPCSLCFSRALPTETEVESGTSRSKSVPQVAMETLHPDRRRECLRGEDLEPPYAGFFHSTQLINPPGHS